MEHPLVRKLRECSESSHRLVRQNVLERWLARSFIADGTRLQTLHQRYDECSLEVLQDFIMALDAQGLTGAERDDGRYVEFTSPSRLHPNGVLLIVGPNPLGKAVRAL